MGRRGWRRMMLLQPPIRMCRVLSAQAVGMMPGPGLRAESFTTSTRWRDPSRQAVSSWTALTLRTTTPGKLLRLIRVSQDNKMWSRACPTLGPCGGETEKTFPAISMSSNFQMGGSRDFIGRRILTSRTKLPGDPTWGPRKAGLYRPRRFRPVYLRHSRSFPRRRQCRAF